MLVGQTAASVAKNLDKNGFDCILGGIDLSIRYVVLLIFLPF